jgi:putative nucleotidyltransferase with HDIG domain
MRDINELVEKINEFPTLPTIYSALLEVLSNPRTTVQDVADVISKDQASSLKILKIVNSAVYGLQSKIDSIAQAIFYIGFNEVKNIVLTLSVIDVFTRTKSMVNFNIVDFWKHSIAVGIITRKLGNVVGVKNTENYFLAGIIHDIGKLFFLRSMNDDYMKVISYVQEKKLSIMDMELKLIGFDHTTAGELLAEKWQLPESIKQTIKYHHTGMVEGNWDLMIACVHLADIVARLLELGNPGDDLVPTPNLEVWKKLDMPENAFTKMYDNLIFEYSQSLGILLLK